MSARAGQARAREAARAAEELARRRRTQQVRLSVLTAALLVVAAVVGLTVAGRDGTSTSQAASDGGLLTTAPPWAPQPVGLTERLTPYGFPPVGDESYHAHALLSVYRDGEQVTVPAGIGFDARGGHSSLHTHTPDGVIHMEADDPYPYKLEQVFVAWGVAFGEDRLGGDVATGTATVHVFVNGQPAPAESVVLQDGDNVVVAFGEAGSFPTAPPADALNGA